MIRHYRDLQVWQRSMKLVVVVYRLTEHFPKSEAYGLTNQIRRAAVSIPSNIAEGHARTSREFGRFLRIARGSMAELETQLEIAMHLEYLPRKQFDEISTELTILAKQLNVLQQRVDAAETKIPAEPLSSMSHQ